MSETLPTQLIFSVLLITTFATVGLLSIWAATSPRLDGMGGVYLEDCDVAEPAPADGTRTGVRDYAADPAEAARLWTLSAELTGVDPLA